MSTEAKLPSIEYLRSVLDLNIFTGVLTWKVQTGARTKVGQRAGHVVTHGYRQVSVQGKVYMEHRVTFAMYHGRWPESELDHIDNVRCNNSPFNLREVTRSENNLNRGVRKDNVSGHKGVGKLASGRFTAKCDGKYIGSFASAEAAAEAIKEAKSK